MDDLQELMDIMDEGIAYVECDCGASYTLEPDGHTQCECGRRVESPLIALGII